MVVKPWPGCWQRESAHTLFLPFTEPNCLSSHSADTITAKGATNPRADYSFIYWGEILHSCAYRVQLIQVVRWIPAAWFPATPDNKRRKNYRKFRFMAWFAVRGVRRIGTVTSAGLWTHGLNGELIVPYLPRRVR